MGLGILLSGVSITILYAIIYFLRTKDIDDDYHH
jgi:hypothetical protein